MNDEPEYDAEYQAYLAAIRTASREHPDWRYGQAAFNTLLGFRRDLADRVDGSRMDPFYDDNLMPAFLGWLRRALQLDAIIASLPDPPPDDDEPAFSANLRSPP